MCVSREWEEFYVLLNALFIDDYDDCPFFCVLLKYQINMRGELNRVRLVSNNIQQPVCAEVAHCGWTCE